MFMLLLHMRLDDYSFIVVNSDTGKSGFFHSTAKEAINDYNTTQMKYTFAPEYCPDYSQFLIDKANKYYLLAEALNPNDLPHLTMSQLMESHPELFI